MKNHIPIIYIILFFALISCAKQETKEEANTAKEALADDVIVLTEAQFRTAQIETGTVSLHDLSTVVKANGKLDVPPQNLVSISAPLGGF
ncbi:MAG: efflux transporter periplasmic adaptor subunit, partial [Cytophaga sp.]|nr:efflux transporter periplasmic adaptor subunit [Cytophaga sp.]